MICYGCKDAMIAKKYRILCVLFALIDCLLLGLICVIISMTSGKTEEKTSVNMVFEEQPEVGNDIMCFDPITGHVYSCFERSDGNVQIRINPEGSRVIWLFIEEKVRQDATQKSVRFMLIAMAIYLGDKREWRPDSICRAIKGINNIAESITGNYTTYKETEQALLDDYGIVIDENCSVYRVEANKYNRTSEDK